MADQDTVSEDARKRAKAATVACGHSLMLIGYYACRDCIASAIACAVEGEAAKEDQLRARLADMETEMANLRDEILRLRDFADRMSEPFPEMPVPAEDPGGAVDAFRARGVVGRERALAAAEYRAWRGSVTETRG